MGAMRRGIEPSAAVAALLQRRRAELGLTLRQVEARAQALGEPIPFTVIARVEKGQVDPGFRRVNILLRIYEIPLQVAGDLADLEIFGADAPAEAPLDYEDAIRSWKTGDLRTAIAHLLALKRRAEDDPARDLERQKVLLAFAITAGSLGKYRLSRQIVDEILLEPPDPSLLVSALTQAAVCWHRLGSGEVALALLARAEGHVGKDDHKRRAWVHHSRAATLASMGRFDEARAELDRALAAYRAGNDPYGESRAYGVLVRLLADRGDLAAALEAARRAQQHARAHDHARLLNMRRVDEGRVLLALGQTESAVAALNGALSAALAMQDGESQFHAHYQLWKAYGLLQDQARADLELRASQYYVRFLDETTPEAVEVRATLGTRGEATAVASRDAVRPPARRDQHSASRRA